MKEVEFRKILEAYSMWLEDCGYLDSDWWCENPNAIDRYLEENPIIFKKAKD